MNSPAVLKTLLLNRHREDLKNHSALARFVEPMSAADEAWLVAATEEMIEQLAAKPFPLYRIYLTSIPATGAVSVGQSKHISPSEWVLVAFFSELRLSLSSNRGGAIADWGFDSATERWLLAASPMDIASALRNKVLRVTSTQGRGGFQSCLEARNLAANYLHLLRGVSTPASHLGHVSPRYAAI